MSSPVVSVKESSGLCWVAIDNPPVNATSAAVRQGLLDAVRRVGQRPVRAAILRCEGRTFVAGGDISEFDAPPVKPDLPDVIREIEDCPVPWIAAMHGSVFGGGLEIALGCDTRVAVSGTRFALPEVKLGIVPGAGGTQRLPRLIGLERAIEMTTTGEPVDAEAFLAAGGLDLILPDLDTETLAGFASAMTGRRLAVRQRRVDPPEPAWLAVKESELRARAGGEVAPLENLRLVAAAGQLPFDEALARERALHLKLRTSDQSRALRHIFFAERKAVRGLAPDVADRAAARLRAALLEQAKALVAGGHFPQAADRAWRRLGATGQILTADEQSLTAEPVVVELSEAVLDDPVCRDLVAILVNEGARLVEAELLPSADMVDVVAVSHLGFPRWRGGPMYLAGRVGLASVSVWMRSIIQESPGAWSLSMYLDRALP